MDKLESFENFLRCKRLKKVCKAEYERKLKAISILVLREKPVFSHFLE